MITVLWIALFLMSSLAGFLYLLWSDANRDVDELESLILYLDSEMMDDELSLAAAVELREQANEIREWAEEQKGRG